MGVAVKSMSVIFAIAITFLHVATNCHASGDYHGENKSAIVLAMFGTTVEPALQSLLNIRNKIEKKFPETVVRVSFTSNIIRKKWHHRAEDADYIKSHSEIPDDILHVKTPLATIADLQNDGYTNIVVQPTHVSMGEEFLDLQTYVQGLLEMGTIKKQKYKPFHKIALGRPALGTYGTEFPYQEDITMLAETMAPDAELAKGERAGILYMGHGNEYFPGSGGAYLELAAKMRKMYPAVVTVIGNVEGFPGIEDAMEALKLYAVKKVILKPFMVVAGDHTLNDMAGDEAGSWKSILEKNGFDVIPVAQGLGENDAFCDIFVNHAIDAAKDAGIALK